MSAADSSTHKPFEETRAGGADFGKPSKTTARRPSLTLAAALEASDGKGPGFHFLRHALSTVILLYHASFLAIGAPATSIATKGDAIGTVTMLYHGASDLFTKPVIIELLRPFLYSLVAAFFALSGFLVAGSALRTRNVRSFLAFRIFRIIPALSSEVLLSGFVLGPLVTSYALGGYFSDPALYRYLGNIFGFVSFELPGVFDQNPIPATVNANLWTLPPEFYCYLAMTALMLAGVLYRKKSFFLLFAVMALTMVALEQFGVPSRLDTTRFSKMFLVYMFVIGVTMWIYAQYIPLNRYLFLACAAAYYVLVVTRWSDYLAGAMLAYCVVFVGMMRFDLFDRLVKVDLSYGIYLYGFPITQTLIFFLAPYLSTHSDSVKRLSIMALSLPLTIGFAWASWILVERPALGLKKLAAPKKHAAHSSCVPRLGG